MEVHRIRRPAVVSWDTTIIHVANALLVALAAARPAGRAEEVIQVPAVAGATHPLVALHQADRPIHRLPVAIPRRVH